MVWEGDITKGQIHKSCGQDAKECKVLLRSPRREAEVCTRLSRTWVPGDPQHEPDWSGFRSQREGEEQKRQRRRLRTEERTDQMQVQERHGHHVGCGSFKIYPPFTEIRG